MKDQAQHSGAESSKQLLNNEPSKIDLPEYMAVGFTYDQLDQLENPNDKTANNVEASMTRAANFYPDMTDRVDDDI